MSLGKKRPSVVDFEDWEQEEALAGLSGLSLAKEDEGHRPFKRSKSFSSGMELESPEIPAHNPLSPILFTTPSKTLLLTHTPLSDSPLDLSLFDDDDEDDEAEQKDQKDSSIPDFLLKPLKDQTNSS